jgi:hypothetical protein
MPDEPDNNYPFDEQLHAAVTRFNLFFPYYTRWSAALAPTGHVDVFGEHIEPWEPHYQRACGPTAAEVLRLSRWSMECMLSCLTRCNERYETVAERIAEMERTVEAETLAEILLTPPES